MSQARGFACGGCLDIGVVLGYGFCMSGWAFVFKGEMPGLCDLGLLEDWRDIVVWFVYGCRLIWVLVFIVGCS